MKTADCKAAQSLRDGVAQHGALRCGPSFLSMRSASLSLAGSFSRSPRCADDIRTHNLERESERRQIFSFEFAVTHWKDPKRPTASKGSRAIFLGIPWFSSTLTRPQVVASPARRRHLGRHDGHGEDIGQSGRIAMCAIASPTSLTSMVGSGAMRPSAWPTPSVCLRAISVSALPMSIWPRGVG
jgi:hypothetical protein